MLTSDVIFYGSRGFGFINNDGDDLFYHVTDVLEGRDSTGYLRQGDIVSFRIGADPQGRPRAVDIKLIKESEE